MDRAYSQRPQARCDMTQLHKPSFCVAAVLLTMPLAGGEAEGSVSAKTARSVVPWRAAEAEMQYLPPPTGDAETKHESTAEFTVPGPTSNMAAISQPLNNHVGGTCSSSVGLGDNDVG
jgi:hypothetical protein